MKTCVSLSLNNIIYNILLQELQHAEYNIETGLWQFVMGNCPLLPRRNSARVYPSNDTEVATASPEPERDDRRKTQYHNVNPNIPESFYPHVVSIGRAEEECRLNRKKITVKEAEKPLRSRVESALNEWRQSGFLGLIESHALSIPAEKTCSLEMLAMNLTLPHTKYINVLIQGENSCFYLQIAKAYAIYFWIANNIRFSPCLWKSFVSNSEKKRLKAEPEEVLEKRECLSIGHANLFNSIAMAIGLKSRVVLGNIRTALDQTALNFSDESEQQGYEPSRLNQHWWNLVSLYCCISTFVWEYHFIIEVIICKAIRNT